MKVVSLRIAAVAAAFAGLGGTAHALTLKTPNLPCQILKYRDVDPGAKIFTVIMIINSTKNPIPESAVFEISHTILSPTGPRIESATKSFNYLVDPGSTLGEPNPFPNMGVNLGQSVSCKAYAHWTTPVKPPIKPPHP